MQLVWPSQEHLSSYIAALERGWSPNNLRPEAGREELVLIQADPERFLASLVDPEAKGPPVALPDGGTVPRLPGYRRWMWDGEFCGSIQLRWQPGTNALPEYCLGHIGYAVVPWKSGRGYARTALRTLLPEPLAAWRPLLAEGMAFFLERLPEARLGAIVAEQIALASSASAAARATAVLAHCPTLHKLGQIVARQPGLDAELRRHLQALESLPASTGVDGLHAHIHAELGADHGLHLADRALAEGSVAVVLPFSWRHVGRTEIDGLGVDLLDAGARAHALVVHLAHAGLVELVSPLFIDGLGKRGACARNFQRVRAVGGSQKGRGQQAFDDDFH